MMPDSTVFSENSTAKREATLSEKGSLGGLCKETTPEQGPAVYYSRLGINLLWVLEFHGAPGACGRFI